MCCLSLLFFVCLLLCCCRVCVCLSVCGCVRMPVRAYVSRAKTLQIKSTVVPGVDQAYSCGCDSESRTETGSLHTYHQFSVMISITFPRTSRSSSCLICVPASYPVDSYVSSGQLCRQRPAILQKANWRQLWQQRPSMSQTTTSVATSYVGSGE